MGYTAAELSKVIFDAWNDKDLNALLDVTDKGFVEHFAAPGLPEGHDGVKITYEVFTTAFPDLKIEINDVIADDSGLKSAVRTTITGTHQGALMGIPATGKSISISAMGFHVAAEGICAESWFLIDTMSMMQQLGVIPAAKEA